MIGRALAVPAMRLLDRLGVDGADQQPQGGKERHCPNFLLFRVVHGTYPFVVAYILIFSRDAQYKRESFFRTRYFLQNEGQPQSYSLISHYFSKNIYKCLIM
jgi:hypothetical protein